jgi:hypothetical protein
VYWKISDLEILYSQHGNGINAPSWFYIFEIPKTAPRVSEATMQNLADKLYT